MLLDNTYCSGILSADGHQWTDTAFATDYMEKSFAGFPRSYPDGMEDDDVDALAYSPAGFIWDNALAHGKTLRDYGEFAITRKPLEGQRQKKGRPSSWTTTAISWTRHRTINLHPRRRSNRCGRTSCTNTVGWDMDVPDVFRAAQFIKELKRVRAERRTSRTWSSSACPTTTPAAPRPASPTPAAQVADNDLAFGQIVEAISHSRFWTETCIFAIEDDPQNGWDHVSGYRTTAYVISPYTQRGTQSSAPSTTRRACCARSS